MTDKRLAREQRFRDAQIARGFKQVRVWVPADKVENIRSQALKYRGGKK